MTLNIHILFPALRVINYYLKKLKLHIAMGDIVCKGTSHRERKNSDKELRKTKQLVSQISF